MWTGVIKSNISNVALEIEKEYKVIIFRCNRMLKCNITNGVGTKSWNLHRFTEPQKCQAAILGYHRSSVLSVYLV
jgi:hypothetical protein